MSHTGSNEFIGKIPKLFAIPLNLYKQTHNNEN
jgi:hypothetical protein